MIFDLDIDRMMTLTLYQRKGLITWNTHAKYESFITCHSKVMANVQVFFFGRQTDKQQKIYAPNPSMQGHENH